MIDAFEAAEVSRRSLRSCARVSLVAMALVFILAAPLSAPFVGTLSLPQSIALIGSAWLIFVLAALTHHQLGPQHGITRFFSAVDVVAWRLCTFGLIYCAGASSPLWAFSIVTGFSFTPRTERAHQRLKRVLIAGVVCLSLSCLVRGHITTAIWMLVVLHTVVLELSVTHGLLVHDLRMRDERDELQAELDGALLARDRDRLARNLHDAVGADLTALILRLRLATRDLPEEEGGALSLRAQKMLERLRRVVRDIRGSRELPS